MIDRVRTFIGYREYPKYGMVSRYFIYKQALLEEAERLVQAQRAPRDGGHLLPHVPGAPRRRAHRTRWMTGSSAERKDAFRSYQALTPPRVLTSDGEVVAGDVPTRRPADRRAGRPAGLRRDRRGAGPRHPRHGGGRARSRATSWSRPTPDPSWSPLFVAINGPGDRGRGPDDPRRGDRPGVRLAGRRGRGARHAADPGWAADPGEWSAGYVEILPRRDMGETDTATSSPPSTPRLVRAVRSGWPTWPSRRVSFVPTVIAVA